MTIQSLSIEAGTVFLFGGQSLTASNGITLWQNGTLRLLHNTTVNAEVIVEEGALLEVNAGNIGILNGNLSLITGTLATGRSGVGGTLQFKGAVFTNDDGTYNDLDGTIIFNGTSAQSIGGTSTTTFHNLTIDNSSGVSLNTDATVNGVLALSSGQLTLGTHNLTLGPSATVAGTFSSSNMVVTNDTGELRKQFTAADLNTPFTFPVGDVDGTAEYAPATLEFTSGTFAPDAYVGVRVVDEQEPNHSDSTNYLTRYWSVKQSDITSFLCNVTFQYDSGDVVGTDMSSQMVGGQWNGTSWNSLGVVDASNDEVEGTVSSFSTFTGRDANVLAVDLATFTASAEEAHVRLEWATVWESNNLGFNVYRNTSQEMPDTPLNSSLIPAAAPGSGMGSLYEYQDVDVTTGTTYYYWLGDVDVAGNETRHGPVSITLEEATAVRIRQFEGQTSEQLGWLVVVMMLGMTFGIIFMQRLR